ncbi:MAG: autotransporter strand-loop-strand O-heptosyltransferase [Selenomonadaceae bacterium]|nr:autotransporter strand-loop-strand O-heptosyltransferase [Selenomonadaceae bacterium]
MDEKEKEVQEGLPQTDGKEHGEQGKEQKKHGVFTMAPNDVVPNTKIPGLGIDFNLGMRVMVPEGDGWRVRAVDMDTDFVVFDGPVPGGKTIASGKTYFIRWKIEVYHGDERVHEHIYDARGKDVVIDCCSTAMGDTLAFVPYARVFKEQHGCRKVYFTATDAMRELLAPSYPDIEFIARDTHPQGVYATYYVGNFYPSTNRKNQPYTWHLTGLQGCAYHILGLPEQEVRPELLPTKRERVIQEPYVCIAAQASAQCKYWNNPSGWMDTIQFLKEQGYRVLCIDKDRIYGGTGDVWNMIPWGSEDFTGNIPLIERVNLLHHADFFIGLGSGLSWLAWGTGIPVIMISGFSTPQFEFRTPYRVINLNVCNGCFNDGQQDFDMTRFDWCPRHQDDPKQRFQCTKAITPGHVIRVIRQLMKDHGLNPKGQDGTRDAGHGGKA